MIEIKNLSDKAIVSIDLEGKNSHTFEDGTTIRLERAYNNLNFRQVNPVNAVIVSHNTLPKGTKVLIHHNSIHDVGRIFDFKPLSGDDIADTKKYFSIPESDCFLYLDEATKEYKPCNGYATALRVFKPYEGTLKNISPSLIPEYLYITSGELNGKVCKTVKASDYQIVYQGEDGREKNVIRVRHYENEYNEREEIIAIHHEMTTLVQQKKLLVGLTENDAKTI